MTMTETRRWHGMDAARVYEMYAQTERWIDQQGESHRLKAMDTRYLRTVRRFMERNGPAHCLAALWGAPLYRAVLAELRERRRLVRLYKVRHWTDLGVPTYREAVPF